MSGTNLPVSSTLGGLGAIVDLGATQTSATRSYSLNSNNQTLVAQAANPVPADAIAIYVSADNFVTDSAYLGTVTSQSGNPSAESSGGESGGHTTFSGVYRYARTLRTVVAYPATPTCTAFVGDLVNGSSAATGIVANGGQPLGINWVVGPSDNFGFSLLANNVQWAAAAANGTTTFGSSAAGAATFIRSGTTGNVTVDSGTTGTVLIGTGANGKSIAIGNTTGATSVAVSAGTGGIGIGAAPQANGVAVDAPVAGGTILVGSTNAAQVTVGNASVGEATSIQAGTAGALLTSAGGTVGITTTGAGAGAISIIANTNQAVIVNSGTTGDLNFGTGAAGADASAKTVRVGTGAAAKTIVIGSVNTTSTTTINAGSGGIQVAGSLVLNAPVALGNQAGGTTLTAASTVDTNTLIQIGQTAAIITYAGMLLLPPPTQTAAGKVIYIQNTGTAAFTIGDATQKQGVNCVPGNTPGTTNAASVNKGQTVGFIWMGAQWAPIDGGPGIPVEAGNLSATTGAVACPRVGRYTRYIANSVTGGITITLSAAGALIGDVIRITRTDFAGAFTVAVNNSAAGLLATLPVSSRGFIEATYAGADWILSAGGAGILA